MKRTDLTLRSMLFVPAHQERFLESATHSEADALILDLEDAVPAGKKALARQQIREWVQAGKFAGKAVFCRVNPRDSGSLLKDFSALTIEGIHGFVYPKSYSSEDIFFVDKLLGAFEAELGLPIGKFKLAPLVETPSAALNAQAICAASERVIALAFGCEDFLTDLEGTHGPNEESLFTPRALVAMAARSHGVIPVDTVYVDVHNTEGFEGETRLAKSLGFEGSLVLHPKQVTVAHNVYTPSAEEVARAEKIVRLSKEAQKDGHGVAILDGEFIGPPLVAAAKNLVERAKRMQRTQLVEA